MSVELLGVMVSEFAGDFPNVPFAPGVDAEGIKADDPNPMFVTLPLLEVGGKSENGFTWGPRDVERVAQEINSKRPEGILGHVPVEERSTRYDLPKLRWVGAMTVRGKLWGKAYIPQYAGDVREYFRLAKRTGARVGTSVYGRRGAKGLEDMTLESIDIGHNERLGSRAAAAIPVITSEMQDGKPTNKGENPTMSEVQGDSLKLVSELTTARDNALRQISELTSKVGERDNTITEMQKRDGALKSVEGLVAEFAGADAVAKVTALVAELRDLRGKQQKAQVDNWIAEAIKVVELEELRPTIIAQMGEVDSADKAKARVTELMGREDIKVIAEALVSRAAGPRAIVGAGNSRTNPFAGLDKPETIADARAALGI